MDSLVLLTVRLRGMRTGTQFTVTPADHDRLETIISAPASPQKHVWRARIFLWPADGIGRSAIMGRTGKSKTCVWRWQERFMVKGGPPQTLDLPLRADIKPMAERRRRLLRQIHPPQAETRRLPIRQRPRNCQHHLHRHPLSQRSQTRHMAQPSHRHGSTALRFRSAPAMLWGHAHIELGYRPGRSERSVTSNRCSTPTTVGEKKRPGCPGRSRAYLRMDQPRSPTAASAAAIAALRAAIRSPVGGPSKRRFSTVTQRISARMMKPRTIHCTLSFGGWMAM